MTKLRFQSTGATQCEILIFGGRGLAGTALVNEARRRNKMTLSASRNGDIQVDACNADSVLNVLSSLKPSAIINVAAIASIALCEVNPTAAWQLNTRLPFLLAEYAHTSGCQLVHVSTDHYYSGDERKAHYETDPVEILNEYARTKYAAESILGVNSSVLVVRTNFIGLQSSGGVSFGEWAVDSILHDKPGVVFDDQFVSSLDVWSFSEILLDMLELRANGIYNLASAEVFSKAEMFFEIAHALGTVPSKIRVDTVVTQNVKRGNSLGLNVSRAEQLLNRRLPSLKIIAGKIGSEVKSQRAG